MGKKRLFNSNDQRNRRHTAWVISLHRARPPWSCGTGEARLGPGDTLVIFTDGVSDATSDSGEEFGEERLVDLLRQHAGSPAPAVLDAIVGAVRDHSADEQFDDLTLIVARVR